MDDCASLGFDGRRVKWAELIAALDRAVSDVLFVPESQDAPVLITGPAESAGLAADAVWFLGADEDAWPARAPRTRCFRLKCSVKRGCHTRRHSMIGIWQPL